MFNSEETITCRFDMYRIDIKHENKIDRYFCGAELTKRKYATILRSFARMPQSYLWVTLITTLCYPPSRSLPVAVEMTTLQKDVHEIGGEDLYSFTFSIVQMKKHARIDVVMRLVKMENHNVPLLWIITFYYVKTY